ncbi:hypothetical protein [Paraburkholderia sp. C35]|uniref:hypothetical protein n=1 Tax=Paraburkholderia sp. C35 TaxID=2126993 RepID=UPI000D69CA54|nr:hypothetical protein [Paraburkholderia sp. C35]
MSADLKSLPLNGLAASNTDVAAHLRQQADWMTEDDAREVANAFLVIEYGDGSIRRQVCGRPCDLARTNGVLTMSVIQSTVGVSE